MNNDQNRRWSVVEYGSTVKQFFNQMLAGLSLTGMFLGAPALAQGADPKTQNDAGTQHHHPRLDTSIDERVLSRIDPRNNELWGVEEGGWGGNVIETHMRHAELRNARLFGHSLGFDGFGENAASFGFDGSFQNRRQRDAEERLLYGLMGFSIRDFSFRLSGLDHKLKTERLEGDALVSQQVESLLRQLHLAYEVSFRRRFGDHLSLVARLGHYVDKRRSADELNLSGAVTQFIRTESDDEHRGVTGGLALEFVSEEYGLIGSVGVFAFLQSEDLHVEDDATGNVVRRVDQRNNRRVVGSQGQLAFNWPDVRAYVAGIARYAYVHGTGGAPGIENKVAGGAHGGIAIDRFMFGAQYDHDVDLVVQGFIVYHPDGMTLNRMHEWSSYINLEQYSTLDPIVVDEQRENALQDGITRLAMDGYSLIRAGYTSEGREGFRGDLVLHGNLFAEELDFLGFIGHAEYRSRGSGRHEDDQVYSLRALMRLPQTEGMRDKHVVVGVHLGYFYRDQGQEQQGILFGLNGSF